VKLEGKSALVTGGGGGIGRGIVMCLAEEGADVAVVDIDPARAEVVAAEASKVGRRCIPMKVDVSRPEEIDAIIESAIKEFGKLDILVNNAGVGAAPDWEVAAPMRVEDWDYVYQVNLRAYYLAVKAVMPHMIERRFGKIINVASVAGRVGGGPNEMMWPYRATKAAVINLSQSMAVQLGPFSVNVNCICPGLIWTTLWDTKLASSMKINVPAFANMDTRKIFETVVAMTTPLAHEQTPEDIGRAVAFLASEEAKNITGQALNVDGGSTLS
jgi:meso-butanediol dehydrogenase/(S,S)-butanediol dehydrogenase/diacetyl reductase